MAMIILFTCMDSYLKKFIFHNFKKITSKLPLNCKIALINQIIILMEDYIIYLGDTMAKPIASTPVLEGEDVIDLINYMKRPLTKKEKEFNERVKKAKKIPRL